MAKLKALNLNVTELQKFRTEQTALFAKCGVTGKEIRLTFYGGIQVWQNGELIKEFIQPFLAVEFFNEL